MKTFLFLMIINVSINAQNLIVGGWLTITPPADLVSDSTSVLLVEFWNDMNAETVLNLENYSLRVDDQEKRIFRIKTIDRIDGIAIDDLTLIALVVEKLKSKKEYFLTVRNVEDKTGIKQIEKVCWFFFNGFVPNLLKKPNGLLIEKN